MAGLALSLRLAPSPTPPPHRRPAPSFPPHGRIAVGCPLRRCTDVVACRATASFQKLDAASVREEESAFRAAAAAAGHNLLPLKRCIFSDHLTPVLAYRCLVREDDRDAPSFLFESVEQGSEGTNVRRYSVVGAQPAMEIVAKINNATVMDHEMKSKKERMIR